MGTRSDIIVHRADGKWHRIYCHWDGYLEHNGKILFDHYTDQKHADALVALGDISILAPEIGVKHPFEQPADRGKVVDGEWIESKAVQAYRKKYGNMCKAYGRDRGEKDVVGTIGDTLQAVWPEEDCWTEFTYVWDQDKWWCGLPDEGTQTLLDLGDLLQGKRTLAAPVKAFGAVIGQHGKTEPGKDHSWSGR